MGKFRCVVSADLMRRAYICVSKEETRYYLRGVQIEPCAEGGALLVATDGAKMVVFRDPQGHVEGHAIVQLRPYVLKALKPVSRESGDRVLAVDGQKAAVIAHACDTYERKKLLVMLAQPTEQCVAYQPTDALVDGSFPDWRRALPRAGTTPAVSTFNAGFLKNLGDALSGDHAACLTIVPADDLHPENCPHLVFGDGAFQAVGVIMPLRAGRSIEQLVRPSWADSQ